MTQEHFGGAYGTSGQESIRPRLTQAARREWFLFKVDIFLDGRVSGRERKRILREIRTGIISDSASQDHEGVIAGLGSAKDLAASYAQGAPKTHPLYSVGLAAAMLTLMLYGFVHLIFAIGMLAVVEQTGGEFHATFFWVDVLAFSNNDGIGVGWSGTAVFWLPVAFAAVTFALAARVWRVFRRTAK